MRVFRILPTPIATEIAYAMWKNLGRPEAVHERDAAVHARAVTGELVVNGKRVVTYRWGNGRRVILLVHGWRSRASRLSALVAALEGPDCTIVSFDAPGNGDSEGRSTTVLDYAEAIHELGEQYGPFQAIVGHSFGVLSTFLAVREGAATRRIVGISGMHTAAGIVDEFSRTLGLPARVKTRLRTLIERRTFPVVDDPWTRFVSRVDDPRIPLLLIHDQKDGVVPYVEIDKIADDHVGSVELIRPIGLGHSRVLSDPAIVEAVAAFVRAPVAVRSAASA